MRAGVLRNTPSLWTFGLILGIGAGAFSGWAVSGHDSSFLPTPIAQSIVPALAAFSLGLLFCSARRNPADTTALFIAAFMLRLLVAIAFGYTHQSQDEQILHASAERSLTERLVSGQEFENRGYSMLIGSLYSVFGVNLLVAKIFNVFLGSILPFLLYDITRQVTEDEKTARRVLLFGAFLPPLVFYSAFNLKELTSVFLLVVTIWCLLVPRTSRWIRNALALVSVIATYLLRSGWAAFPLLAVILYQFTGTRRHGRASTLLSPRNIIALAAITLLIAGPLRSLAEGAFAHIQYRIFIGAAASFGSLRNADASVTASLLDLDNVWSLRNLALQTARAPFSPSPLALAVTPTMAGLVIAIVAGFQYFLIPLAAIAVLNASRYRGVLMLAALEMAFLVTIGLSLMLGLTIQRHGIPHFALLYILAGIGLCHWREHRLLIGAWCSVALVYNIVYALAKI